jgi:energy-coupling factor transporter ATP-binding protein EcfA2
MKYALSLVVVIIILFTSTLNPPRGRVGFKLGTGVFCWGLLALTLVKTVEREDSGTVEDTVTPENPWNSSLLHAIAEDSAMYPHIMMIGKTGSGKTTLAQYLAALSPGKTFALAPHLDMTKLNIEWAVCDGVFGAGRNYGFTDDEPIEYEDLVNGRLQSPTAIQIMRCLVAEMDTRYKANQAFESHEVHNWILDETPAVARALGKEFGGYLAPLLYEARKIGMRLIVLTQNDNVETLKIQGEGKMKDNFNKVYLASSAVYQLRKQSKLLRQLKAQDSRWCVVDDTVQLIPDIAIQKDVIETNKCLNRFIASAPGVTPKLPSPADVLKNGIDARVREFYLREQEKTPDLSNTEMLKAWGFTGRYYNVGKELLNVTVSSGRDN